MTPEDAKSWRECHWGYDRHASQQPQPQPEPVDGNHSTASLQAASSYIGIDGSFHTLFPLSTSWGFDAGQPVLDYCGSDHKHCTDAVSTGTDDAGSEYPVCLLCCEAIKVLQSVLCKRLLSCFSRHNLSCLPLLQVIAFGECNYKEICAECIMQMGMLHNNHRCPLCKADLHQITAVSIFIPARCAL